MIELLKKGNLDGKLITKPITAFSDNTTKKMLDILYHRVRALRALFNTHKNSVISEDICNVFDNLKQDVINELNHILVKNGFSEEDKIRGCLDLINSQDGQ
jgi:Zn-dependent M32 family carboxypeptidase